MSSDPILFESEEFDSQDKENRTINEIGASISDLKKTTKGTVEDTQSNAEKQTVDSTQEISENRLLVEDTQNKETSSDNETPTSQDILEGIPSNLSKQTERKEVPSSINEISNSFNAVPSTSTDTITNTFNDKIPDSISDTNSTKEDPITDESTMELSEQCEDSELIEAPDSVEIDAPAVLKNSEKAANKKANCVSEKHCTLPLSRVKLIMKTDPNVKVISSEATILAAIAAEKFVKFIIEETVRITKSKNKKTMMKQHFDEAIQGLEETEFLEGMMDDNL